MANPVFVYLKKNPLVLGLNFFLGLIFLTFLVFKGGSTQPTPAPENLSGPSPMVFETTSFTQNDPVYARPIFHSDRHPARKIEAPVIPFIEAPFNFTLTGVLSVSDSIGWAFFSDPVTGEGVQVALGENIGGWALKKLGENQAIISKDGKEKTLALDNPLSTGILGPGPKGGDDQDQTGKPRTRKRN